MLLEALKVKNVNLKWDFLSCRKLNSDFLRDCLKKLNSTPRWHKWKILSSKGIHAYMPASISNWCEESSQLPYHTVYKVAWWWIHPPMCVNNVSYNGSSSYQEIWWWAFCYETVRSLLTKLCAPFEVHPTFLEYDPLLCIIRCYIVNSCVCITCRKVVK